MTLEHDRRRRPLSGIRILEIGGIGPAPFAGMMLADHGAEVIRVTRPGETSIIPGPSPLHRSRRLVEIDLKLPEGAAIVGKLAASADGLIEGFRPGVMERLALGPDALLAANPRLVYGRMTGWGQSGSLSQKAGHDINYIAQSGVLHLIGPAGSKPVIPANLVGDFGGGGMMLAFGMLAALLHARETGTGQVVDCAMVDGSALLAAAIWGMKANGWWSEGRGTNLLDGGAPFYDSYPTRDGLWVAVGAAEPQFFQRMMKALDLGDTAEAKAQYDRKLWPSLRAKIAAAFLRQDRAAWEAVFRDEDACFSPILSMAEAEAHPCNIDRAMFCKVDGMVQPAPAPRFSHSPPDERPIAADRADDAIMAELGYDAAAVEALRSRNVLGA